MVSFVSHKRFRFDHFFLSRPTSRRTVSVRQQEAPVLLELSLVLSSDAGGIFSLGHLKVWAVSFLLNHFQLLMA